MVFEFTHRDENLTPGQKVNDPDPEANEGEEWLQRARTIKMSEEKQDGEISVRKKFERDADEADSDFEVFENEVDASK